MIGRRRGHLERQERDRADQAGQAPRASTNGASPAAISNGARPSRTLALREAREETGLTIELAGLIDVVDALTRDQAGAVVRH